MKRSHLILLGLVLLIGLFFRSYQAVERFEFAHDGDLYSWIFKDIVVNHHFRLIGQLTSAPGIFIGGLFYYLLIPFFLFFNMDPIGVILFAIIIGLLTITSYYFVFSSLFKKDVGLIAAFLYATLLSTINFDRWVVPTITTNLWVIWYFYTVIKLARGEYKILILAGILIGLIWHVHLALLPTLIAIPAAIFVSKKLPNKKQVFIFLLSFFITSLPLIIFEVRHGFSQTRSLIENFFASHSGETGISKLSTVLGMITKNINTLFLSPHSLDNWMRPLFIVLILSTAFILYRKKLLSNKEIIPPAFWIIGVVGFFTFSSSLISEYYFSNIEIIFITLVSLTLYLIYRESKIGKFLILFLLAFILVKNIYFFTNQYIYHKGYVEKRALVDYITMDAKNKDYPCFGISYITAPGENVGFRYFFLLKKAHLVHPSLDVPVYNIVIPEELSLREVKQKFGHIGLIPPKKTPSKDLMKEACSEKNTNLTDPMFGYVD
ncbi:MAG: Uncharacterized protein G01um10147_99 [Microgenomates group bacterium Gr01-1014_7]|nr:MAG: Uncharacterized protein G01um10147_99 [Microgenomates group bacterium Gr01-1014_7]